MSIKVLARIVFILWTIAVTVLSVISYPGSKDLLMSVKLTSSGFVVHGVAYFVGMLLCYLSFDRRKDRDHMSDARRQLSKVTFIWMSGLLILLYSVLLECVQLSLPYRTFNIYDVVANGVGVLGFVVIWIVFSHPDEIANTKAFHGAGRHTPVPSPGATAPLRRDLRQARTDTPEEYATHSTPME